MSVNEVVFQSIIDTFNYDMFGPYANSITRNDFMTSLSSDGWKYFNQMNLNELFSIKHKESVRNGTITPDKPE